MPTVEDTLSERGGRYGIFRDHAEIAQNLQYFMQQQKGWKKLQPDAKQALCLIADKIARILNGDPEYTDNWHDIQGYAKLVEDRILGRGIYAEQVGDVSGAVKYPTA